MLVRFLLSAWSVLRAIPATAVLSFAGVLVAVSAAAIGPAASLLSMMLSLYTVWRMLRRYYLLHSWMAWTP